MMAPPPPPMGAPGMAAGGLTTLPLPDAMFDEPDVGGYASGGLVAFQTGGAVDDEYPSEDTVVTGRRPDAPKPPPENVMVPDLEFPFLSELGGYFSDLGSNARLFNQQSPRETQRAQEFASYLEGQLSPEARRERQREDMFMTLGQIGARMASTPGSLLQALGAGIGEAVPAAAAAARERRAEERQLRESLLGEERTGNREQMERFAVARDMLGNFNSLDEARKNRSFENLYRSLDRRLQRELGFAEIAAGNERARIGAGATLGSAEISGRYGLMRENAALLNSIIGTARADIGVGGSQRIPYLQAVEAGTGREFFNNLVDDYRQQFGLIRSPTGTSSTPTLQFDSQGNRIP